METVMRGCHTKPFVEMTDNKGTSGIIGERERERDRERERERERGIKEDVYEAGEGREEETQEKRSVLLLLYLGYKTHTHTHSSTHTVHKHTQTFLFHCGRSVLFCIVVGSPAPGEALQGVGLFMPCQRDTDLPWQLPGAQ